MRLRLKFLLGGACLLTAHVAGATGAGALQTTTPAVAEKPLVEVAATVERKKAKQRATGQERWLNPQPEPPGPLDLLNPLNWLNPQPEPPSPALRTKRTTPR